MAADAAHQHAVGRHWVRLKYLTNGEAPNRSEVGHHLLQSQWITVGDIYSFIALQNRREFEIVFNNPRALQCFLQAFQTTNHSFWKLWECFSSTPQDIRLLYVKFWTGRIADEDIEHYLNRYCEILQPVHKPVDQFGLWYGVRRYKVKLRTNPEGTFLQIPTSIMMGPYYGKISYQGQSNSCYICSSSEHQAKDCETIKCWKCGNLGHKGKECSNLELCSLCNTNGHTFFNCPHSFANKTKRPSRLNMAANAPEEGTPRPPRDESSHTSGPEKESTQNTTESTQASLISGDPIGEGKNKPSEENSESSTNDSTSGSESSDSTSDTSDSESGGDGTGRPAAMEITTQDQPQPIDGTDKRIAHTTRTHLEDSSQVKEGGITGNLVPGTGKRRQHAGSPDVSRKKKSK